MSDSWIPSHFPCLLLAPSSQWPSINHHLGILQQSEKRRWHQCPLHCPRGAWYRGRIQVALSRAEGEHHTPDSASCFNSGSSPLPSAPSDKDHYLRSIRNVWECCKRQGLLTCSKMFQWIYNGLFSPLNTQEKRWLVSIGKFTRCTLYMRFFFIILK